MHSLWRRVLLLLVAYNYSWINKGFISYRLHIIIVPNRWAIYHGAYVANQHRPLHWWGCAYSWATSDRWHWWHTKLRLRHPWWRVLVRVPSVQWMVTMWQGSLRYQRVHWEPKAKQTCPPWKCKFLQNAHKVCSLLRTIAWESTLRVLSHRALYSEAKELKEKWKSLLPMNGQWECSFAVSPRTIHAKWLLVWVGDSLRFLGSYTSFSFHWRKVRTQCRLSNKQNKSHAHDMTDRLWYETFIYSGK